ncbi:MAG TPA: hypothetical protein VFA09_05685 [Ktedonobacteraceae bacterium]|jgi:hypothetical protein|nr:hypothetical protein [Ktedonobacteraceae bacterium]
MGRKVIVLILAMIVLIGLSAAYIVGGIQAYSRYLVDNQEHCGGQAPVHICVQAPSSIFSAFYPSYVSSNVPLISVKYSSGSPITLIISASILNFSQQETATVNASANSQTVSFIPPLLNSNVLRQLTNNMNTSLQVRVMDTHNTLYYVDDSPLLLHSRWLMEWVAANRLKIAAWVTPDDPAVAQLVKKAISHLQAQPPPAPTTMAGYDSAGTRAIKDQVDAIFDAMRLDYHIRYVQASVPYGGPGDTNVALQDIHLPFEVLQQRSGMCVELTALLASAVEHIGLHAEIVVVPGHAFLGVAVKSDDSQFEYWDAVEVNNNVAGDSANIFADHEYKQQHIIDTILISDARDQGIGPMI